MFDPLVAAFAEALAKPDGPIPDVFAEDYAVELAAIARRVLGDDRERMTEEVGALRSLLAFLSSPVAPWKWDDTHTGIRCERCTGHKETTDLIHIRDLDWHAENCAWRMARMAVEHA